MGGPLRPSGDATSRRYGLSGTARVFSRAVHYTTFVACRRPLTDFIELCLAHRIRVDDVDNFPQVTAATRETSPYFSGEFLNELGALIFTTYCLQVASSL
jgi:hypothetical protein